MNLREAAQQALESLELVMSHGQAVQKAKDVLRAALAEPEQEPVAWQCSECGGTHLLCPHGRKDVPLYTSIKGRT
jgi:rubrerythrin